MELRQNVSLQVIGVGNPYRRDDGVGLAVATRLRRRTGTALTIIETSGEGASLLELFNRSPYVILIDAIVSGAASGTIKCLDAVAEPLPSRFFQHSSHAFGVAQAVELGRALGQLPSHLTIYGIEGADFTDGEGLSPAVDQAAERVVTQVLKQARSRERQCGYAERRLGAPHRISTPNETNEG